jgi:hypothetical protein
VRLKRVKLKLNLKNGRIVGYVLLAIGIIVIFFAIFEMILVFTSSNAPPKLFNFSDISTNGTLLISGQNVNKASDMLAWFVLMAFIMWGGGKIASLGVNLLREIKVEIKGALKTAEEKETAKTEPETEPQKEPKKQS